MACAPFGYFVGRRRGREGPRPGHSAVHLIFYGLSRCEGQFPRGSNLNGSAGRGISSFAGRHILHLEFAEPVECYLVAVRGRIGDRREDSVEIFAGIEELESTNEELETSKEELQSVNEELQTVNGELAHRVSDLARANSDLKNLLESAQIATLFLDNDLRLRNFTPAATEIFHLVDTDIGRPIDHLAPRVVYPELKGDVRRVLKALAPVEREVTGVEGARTYVARVLPYRSIDNFIAGAVLKCETWFTISRTWTARCR